MFRRLSVTVLLVATGFVGGLVLTGRLHSIRRASRRQPAAARRGQGSVAAQHVGARHRGLPDFAEWPRASCPAW